MTRPGMRDWIRHTTPFERVRSIVLAASEPQSIVEIADAAAVPVETTRMHVTVLAEQGVIVDVTVDGDRDCSGEEEGPMFRGAEAYTREKTIQELVASLDDGELVALRDELRDQVEAWQDKHGVTGPGELRDRLDDTAASSSSPTCGSRQEVRRTVNEWELVAYRLDIVEDAVQDVVGDA